MQCIILLLLHLSAAGTAAPLLPIYLSPDSKLTLSNNSTTTYLATTTTSVISQTFIPVLFYPSKIVSTTSQPAATTNLPLIQPILPPGAPANAAQSKPIVAAYYPDWVSDSLTPEDIDFRRFDWIDFAFAVPDSSYELQFSDANAENLLSRLVFAAHAQNTKVKLSVGGWDGSKYFSDAMATSSGRETLASNILKTLMQFHVDGIDIDWEYPGATGHAGNHVSAEDSTNFLIFLQLLRYVLPSNATITAACQVTPFADGNGKPMENVAPFATVLDWVLLMNYDTWGTAGAGANAPLADGCKNSSQPFSNAEAAVATWTNAGFPASKLLLGAPTYGYVIKSTDGQLESRRRNAPSFSAGDPEAVLSLPIQPLPPAWSSVDATSDPVIALSAHVTVQSDDGQQVQFQSLVKQGALERNPLGEYIGAGGFERIWDACSSTPFLRSAAAQQVIPYDDAQSLEVKSAFAHDRGLLGVETFDIHGDTADWELTDAIRKGLRVPAIA